MYKINYFRRL